MVGLNIEKQALKRNRKILLCLSVIFNLGILGFFKYYNFFIESWLDLFSSFGYEIKSVWTLKIILPVGISFYTFQTMSYTIDVYKNKLKPTKDFISFAAFVSFFPQLVAGPIERATNLLPQILNKRVFRYKEGVKGIRLIIWGMFKKITIADNLAPIVDNIFDNYELFEGGTLLLGAIYFAFQIYCDFSGYSDIAIGTSKLFGFNLMTNFKYPYFSRNIGEFWRRWHISLSTWFRDYLYIPLGGSKNGKWNSIRNIFCIFLVSGFWHGANWTFIFWGLFHAMLFLPSFVFNNNRKYLTNVIGQNRYLPSPKEVFQVSLTFLMVTIGWIFFRSEDITSSIHYISKLTSISFPQEFRKELVYYIIPFILFEYIFMKKEDIILNSKKTIFIIIDSILIYYLGYQIVFDDSFQQFIYFQF
jgi:D-alanyl-lipoteichoic acid acyltransferase DltB (MBOAT superfamily)